MVGDDPVESEDVQLLLDGARRLRNEILEPAEKLADHLPAPDNPCEHPVYESALRESQRMGLAQLSHPEYLGGLGAPVSVALRTAEELATGAPGFASRLLLDNLVPAAAAAFAGSRGRERLRALLAAGAQARSPLSWTVVHAGPDGAHMPLPDSGLSLRLPADRPAHDARSVAGGRSVAAASGGLRLSRVRLPLVPNGDACSHLLVVVNDPGGQGGWRTYLIDVAGAQGLTRTPAPRLGLRCQGHGDIVLEDVWLPDDDIVIERDRCGQFVETMVGLAALGTAAVGLGLAARAHDLALEYCRTRVQGGRPIVEHASVAEILWQTFASIESLRSAVRAASPADVTGADLRSALAVRASAAGAVHAAAVRMLELLGGYGVTTDYPLEKLYRDAQVLLHVRGWVEGLGVHAPVALS